MANPKLSNEALIQKFVQASLKKEEVLLANSALRAQSILSSQSAPTNQLISRQEGLIASSHLEHDCPEIAIRQTSSYWELMQQVLVGCSCVTNTQQDPESPFQHYQYIKTPPGYSMSCTQAKLLWRLWWRKYRRLRHTSGLTMELLVRVRQTWYPIRALEISNGMIFITTLVDEVSLSNEDHILWLEKIAAA